MSKLLTPMSRNAMRSLKSDEDEKVRLTKIKDIVQTIYTYAIQYAKGSTETSYRYMVPKVDPPCGPGSMMQQKALPQKLGLKISKEFVASKDPPNQHYGIPNPFYIENMPSILAVLQDLFPDSSVSHTLLAKGTDGKFYDISKLDDKVLPFVNRALDESYIVIDWS
jgi:hypothetical protein